MGLGLKAAENLRILESPERRTNHGRIMRQCCCSVSLLSRVVFLRGNFVSFLVILSLFVVVLYLFVEGDHFFSISVPFLHLFVS